MSLVMRHLMLVVLWAVAAIAQAQVDVPPLTRRVTDLTATLNSAQTSALENKISAFEAKKGSQIAVLIIPTTQPEDIAQFGIRVADAWKIGREQYDDGVILIVAKADRRLRIEVGYGLEGAIPDAIAKRLIEDIIKPYFKQGNYAAGIDAGVTGLMRLIEGEGLPAPQAGIGKQDNAFVLIVFAGVVLGYILSAMIGRPLSALLVSIGSVGAAILLLGLTWLMALFIGVMVFFMVVARPNNRRSWSTGGFSGGGSWGGGGGGFGGGGSSGSW